MIEDHISSLVLMSQPFKEDRRNLLPIRRTITVTHALIYTFNKGFIEKMLSLVS